MAKQTSVAKKVADFENGSVTFKFADDTTIEARLDSMSDEIVRHLALHGLSQKLGDSYAGAGSEADPVAYAKEAVESVLTNLQNGDWSVRVAGTAGPRVTMLVEALARATGRDVDEVAETINPIREAAAGEGEEAEAANAKLDAIKANPTVKAAMSEIRAERAAAKAEKDAEGAKDAGDLSDLLG